MYNAKHLIAGEISGLVQVAIQLTQKNMLWYTCFWWVMLGLEDQQEGYSRLGNKNNTESN